MAKSSTKNKRRIPRRRFHALHIEIVVVAVVALLLAYCTRSAIRHSSLRRDTTLSGAICGFKASFAPQTDSPRCLLPSVFAFGPDDVAVGERALPHIEASIRHKALGADPAVAVVSLVKEPHLVAPSLPMPGERGDVGIAPAPPLYSQPRSLPTLSDSPANSEYTRTETKFPTHLPGLSITVLEQN